MRKLVFRLTVLLLCLCLFINICPLTAYCKETHSTIYSDTEFPCKFEITAPSEVAVGEEFEITFKWSEYNFDTCVSAFTVQFTFDTRYVVLKEATPETVTIVGSKVQWTDCCNFGDGKGLGAIEAVNKSSPSIQFVSIGFFNENDEICMPDEFTVKVKFKALYAGDPAFDWEYLELFDQYFEYEVYSEMHDASTSIIVTDNNGNTEPPTHLKGDVNNDGSANSLDAALVLKHDALLIVIASEKLSDADVSADGAVDSLDAALILKHDAGLIQL